MRTTSQLGGSSSSGLPVTGNGASGTANTANPVIVGAEYRATRPTYADGQRTTLQANTRGDLGVQEQYAALNEDNVNGVEAGAVKPLATSTYSWTLFTNFKANATLNVKPSPGNLKSIYCRNLNAAVRYLQIHNTATVPAGGAVPVLTYLVPVTGVVFVDGQTLGENGYNLSNGIAFAFSTDETTYVAGAAADQVTQIMFK